MCQGNNPPKAGGVVVVSAQLITDERRGTEHYKIRQQVDETTDLEMDGRFIAIAIDTHASCIPEVSKLNESSLSLSLCLAFRCPSLGVARPRVRGIGAKSGPNIIGRAH